LRDGHPTPKTFRQRLPVPGKRLRHQSKARSDVRPVFFGFPRHLVEHLADVLQRARDVVQVAEVLSGGEEIEVHAQPFDHHLGRQPVPLVLRLTSRGSVVKCLFARIPLSPACLQVDLGVAQLTCSPTVKSGDGLETRR
jgi:hypothetical protein